MSVTSARCFKTAVCLAQAGVQLIAAWSYKTFVWSPRAGGKALRIGNHLKRIFGRTQMLLASFDQICRHRRAQSIAKAVGVVMREYIAIFGERIEIGFVQEKTVS